MTQTIKQPIPKHQRIFSFSLYLTLSIFAFLWAANLPVQANSRATLVTTNASSVDVSLLYKPSYTIFYRSSAYETYIQGRLFHPHWLGYEPWSVPLEPSWDEDPYDDRSWALYYHSLIWLYSPAYGYDHFGDSALLSEAIDYIEHFVTHNPPENSPSPEAWGDAATAIRAATIAYFYSQHANEMTPSERATIETAAQTHADELITLIENPIYADSNHGIFHALALYNLGKVFVLNADKDSWVAIGKTRFAEVFGNMVDIKEGVSKEQAAAYQFNVIRMIADGFTVLRNNNETDLDWVKDVLVEMVKFAALLLYPDGTAPAIGESNYNTPQLWLLNQFSNTYELDSDILEFVRSNGEVGSEPPKLVHKPNQGYILIRPEFSQGDDWLNDSMLAIDVGPPRFSHGHHDATNFSLFAQGAKFIIDTGGPFKYTPSWRATFAKASMQNVAVIDGDETPDQLVEVVATEFSKVISNVGVVFDAYKVSTRRMVSNVSHERHYVFLSPNEYEDNIVVVIDQFSPYDRSGLHEYRLYHHLSPTVEVSPNAEGYSLVAENMASMDINLAASYKFSVSIIEGQTEPDYQGWVVPGASSMSPAPTLEQIMIAQSRQNFVTTFVSAPPGQQPTTTQTSLEQINGASVLNFSSGIFGNFTVALPTE